MDTGSFRIYILHKNIYVDIAKDFKTVLYTSSYELERQFPEGNLKNLSDQ